MGSKTPEGRIKRAICEYLSMLRRRGLIDFWLVHSQGMFDPVRKRMLMRNSPYDRLGQADIAGILKGGRAIFIEVKANTKQSEHQKAFQESVESMGAVYLLARSVAEVHEFFKTQLVERL
jgi:hypothetical protein